LRHGSHLFKHSSNEGDRCLHDSRDRSTLSYSYSYGGSERAPDLRLRLKLQRKG
ncbi:unnamed protein product, partial [Linum tenue]